MRGQEDAPGTEHWLRARYLWFVWSDDGADLGAAALPGEKLCDYAKGPQLGVLLASRTPRLTLPEGFGAEPINPGVPHVLSHDDVRVVFAVRKAGEVSDGTRTLERWDYLIVEGLS